MKVKRRIWSGYIGQPTNAEALRAAGDELATDAATLLSHREQDNLHPIDYQRLAESLARYREVTGS